MEHVKNYQNKWDKQPYYGVMMLFAVLLLSFMHIAHASDTTGIPDLDVQASASMTTIQFVAKWGGILMVVLIALVIGSGKAKGDVASWLTYGGIAIGTLASAWGWLTTSFTHGYVF